MLPIPQKLRVPKVPSLFQKSGEISTIGAKPVRVRAGASPHRMQSCRPPALTLTQTFFPEGHGELKDPNENRAVVLIDAPGYHGIRDLRLRPGTFNERNASRFGCSGLPFVSAKERVEWPTRRLHW